MGIRLFGVSDSIREEIWHANPRDSPVTHGLLNVLARVIHNSPYRYKLNPKTPEDDWHSAVGVLVNYSGSNKSNMNGLSVEGYLHRKISYVAFDLSKKLGNNEPYKMWMESVNIMAFDVLITKGMRFFSPKIDWLDFFL